MSASRRGPGSTTLLKDVILLPVDVIVDMTGKGK